jgi:hypothetical protein
MPTRGQLSTEGHRLNSKWLGQDPCADKGARISNRKIEGMFRELSHRVGFVAQALVVFPSLLKSTRKGLFYCHPGILLLQLFQVARHLGRDLIELFAAISGVQSSFEAQQVELLSVSELSARLIVFQSCIDVRPVFVHGVLLFSSVAS